MGTSPNRAELFAEGNRVFAELSAVLDADLHRRLHGEDGDEWIPRDVYAHLGHWQRVSLRDLRESLRTGRLVEQYADETEMNAINAAWKAEAASLTHEAARARCIESKDALQAALLLLSAEQWDTFGVRYAVDVDGQHYRGHLEYIHTDSPFEVP